jgi:acyl carrier protein
MSDGYDTFVRAVLVDTFGLAPSSLTPDVTLDALGLDSLDRAELALTLETFTLRRIDDADIASVDTVASVVELVRRKART